jgi:transposase
MRGEVERQRVMLSVVSAEHRIPADHPLRRIKALADAELARLSPVLAQMYAERGRPSVPPERLLKACLLIALYSIRSERQLCEQLQYNLLFQWFLDLDLHTAPFDASTFAKNKERLLRADVARRFFEGIVQQAKAAGLLSAGHFTVDGIAGHVLMENRHGLCVDILVTRATGTAEREAALTMVRRQRRNGIRPRTLGGDKAYDTADFVADVRAEGITPHVAPNITTRRDSNLDWRTLRHEGYKLSQRCRKKVAEIFGWGKSIGGLRKTRYRAVQRTGFWAYLVGAAYDLLRMAKLMPERAVA